MPVKTKTDPTSPDREEQDHYDAGLSDRFMSAAGNRSVAGFMDEEAVAEGIMTQFGTLITQVSPPRYAKLAAKFFYLAGYCESRPALAEYEPILRLGARTCAIMTALVGSTADQERLRRQVLEDPRESDSFMRHMLQLASLTPEDRDHALTSAVRRAVWSEPTDDCLKRTAVRASLIHSLLERGAEPEAKTAAIELGRDVLGVMLRSERTEEGLFMRNRLATIMRSLRDAGALGGTNIITLVEAALDVDTAHVRAVGHDLAPRRNLH